MKKKKNRHGEGEGHGQESENESERVKYSKEEKIQAEAIEGKIALAGKRLYYLPGQRLETCGLARVLTLKTHILTRKESYTRH